MAVQPFTALQKIPQGSLDFSQSLSDAASGPGKAPYLDGRELAGLFNSYMDSSSHMVYGTVTANADGAASGIDVACGFAPKCVILFNETTIELLLKMSTMAGAFSWKITNVPAVTFANTTLSMGNAAATLTDYFSYNAAEITANDVIHFVAFA